MVDPVAPLACLVAVERGAAPGALEQVARLERGLAAGVAGRRREVVANVGHAVGVDGAAGAPVVAGWPLRAAALLAERDGSAHALGLVVRGQGEAAGEAGPQEAVHDRREGLAVVGHEANFPSAQVQCVGQAGPVADGGHHFAPAGHVVSSEPREEEVVGGLQLVRVKYGWVRGFCRGSHDEPAAGLVEDGGRLLWDHRPGALEEDEGHGAVDLQGDRGVGRCRR